MPFTASIRSPCLPLAGLLCALMIGGRAGAQLPSAPYGPTGAARAAQSPAAGQPLLRRGPVRKPPAPPVGDSRLARFDPSTRMLIDVELREASPAERDHWLTLLSAVDADQVPHLLAARRKANAGRLVGAQPARAPERGAAPDGQTRTGRISTVPPAAGAPGSIRTTSATSATSAAATTAPVEPAKSPPEASNAAAADAKPASPSRRWMAPLRGRWADERNDDDAAEPPPSPSADNRGSAYMNVELQRVMTLLRTEIEQSADGPAGTDAAQRRRHIQMRLLHLLADEPEHALAAVPGLPPEQQEFWIQLLWALANELDPAAGPSDAERLQRTCELLHQAETHLRQACPLAIRHACFCHRINSFGSYERFPRDEFRPDQPVLLYAELQNFRSELTAESQYRTRLRTTMEIHTAQGDAGVSEGAQPVDRRDFPATEDLCRSLRTDYFHSYRIDLPAQLTPGRYVLRLRIVDELSGASASTDLPFVIP